MGSFAITYDDFSGGHYVGEKSASTPSNTWFGTNAILNPQGELISSGSKLVATLAPPTLPTVTPPATIDPYWLRAITNLFTRSGTNLYLLQSWVVIQDNPFTLLWEGRYTEIISANSTGTPTITNFSLGTRHAVGRAVSVGTTAYFIDADTKDICSITNTGTITAISSALSAADIRHLEIYKYRMLAYGGNFLYYSDPTMTTWSATDYYEFPSGIYNVIPRANDLLIITGDGVYSVTGVLGESVNIQMILPLQDQSTEMITAVGTGRSFVFTNEEAIFELVGSSVYEIARFAQSDINKTQTPVFDQIPVNPAGIYGLGINVEEKGTIVVFLDCGAAYIRKSGGGFVRMFVEPTTENLFPAVATSVRGSGLFGSDGNVYALANDQISGYAGGSTNIYRFVYDKNRPITTNSSRTPASAQVQLSEYWHQRPMNVRELIVEAVYDTDETLWLTGNASVSAQIVPTGIVDYSMTQVQNIGSDTQTYTTALNTVPADDTRIIHRFRIDNAPKGYGFYPKLTWQGCRIRRVIAVCED